jgi:hypothetical protein
MKLFSKIALVSILMASGIHPVNAAYNDVGTDYTNFTTNGWIDTGPAGEALGMVDFLLCVMEKTNASTNVNETYSVLVDENLCNGEKATIPFYAHQTITTLRSSAADPYSMKAWFVTGDGMKVVASISIDSGVTASSPMGVFGMTWKAVSPSSAVGSAGTLALNENGSMQYVENMTEDAGTNNLFSFVHGTLTPSTSSGQLRIQAQDYSGGIPVPKVYRYVFDASHAHYDKAGSDAVCLDRAVSTKRVYGYQLFDNAGAKKELSGPFGFKYTVSGDDTEYSGWAHPNGSWLEKSHASGAFDKPKVITRRSDSQKFNICYDEDWSVANGSQRDDGYDDNIAGLATVCGTASDEVVIGLTNFDTNVAYEFTDPLEFKAVSFKDTFGGSSVSNIAGGRYDGAGSSMDLGWQCIQAGGSWADETRNNGTSSCDGAINWRPKYSLPDGTPFVDSTDATIYRVKAMDAQSELDSVNVSNCSDIPVTNAPIVVSYSASDIPDVAITWDQLPTVTSANTIKYIHGVEQ